MAAKFQGATGHSQGVVTAALIAMDQDNKDWESFDTHAAPKALKVLFYIGLRGYVVYSYKNLRLTQNTY